MIWRGQEEFPGVHRFVKKMKLGIMSAHDSIIVARVVHTVQANHKQTAVTCKVGDMVYLSTKNISLPKGRARKLAPKYLGPFAVSKVLKEGATYQLDLSEENLKRGMNRSFHVSLLKPHVPNDDRRFPGRLHSQLPEASTRNRMSGSWTRLLRTMGRVFGASLRSYGRPVIRHGHHIRK